MAARTRPKLAMIGFDSAELSYIQANLASLPNFRRALNRGILTPLESPADLMPGSVWPTFNSGRPPGDHGIYHLMQWDAATMRLRRPSDQWLNYQPFWRKLEARGFKVIALDVPFTFPPQECRGIEITSWGAHDQLAPFSVYPKDLKRELRRRFGEHPMGIEVPVDKPLSERLRIARALVAGAATKGEMMRWLLTFSEWDFFIGVFGETHRGGHILWPDAESRLPPSVLLDVYRALDNALGEILAVLEIQKAITVIFSLHGMGPNHSQEHFVAPLMTQVNARYSEMESPLFPPGFVPRQRSVMRLLRENVPPGIQSAIAKLVPQQVRDAVVDRSFTSGHDWSLTPGLALRADNNGFLRFNLLGREMQGMLPSRSGSQERYSELIHESFASLRTADGARLVKEIRCGADAFPGERTNRLPDLIVVWNGIDPACRVEGKLGTLLAKLDTGRGGNHRPRGFQVILRPNTDRAEVERARPIVEVGPLILRSFTENSSPYA